MNRTYAFLCVLGLAVLGSQSNAGAAPKSKSNAELAKLFAAPRDSVKTACYWYWINGHVSPQGVADDVRAMKRAGINRAFIGVQGFDDYPAGGLKIQSPEWYECMRSAMATATKEGVEIGVFNCPGWSQAGGPWVKPDESMRYLGMQQKEVEGTGQAVSISFDKPENILSTAKVLAYPSRGHRTATVVSKSCKAVGFHPAQNNFTLRSITIKPQSAVLCEMVVSAKEKDDSQFKEVGHYTVNRSNIEDGVGYDRLAPMAFAIPSLRDAEYRVEFKNITMMPAVPMEVVFSEAPVVNSWSEQILAKMHQTPQPYWNDYKWNVPVAFNGADGAVSAEEVIDLTDKLSGNTLTYAFPKGKWTVVRAYIAPTGICNSPTMATDGRGLEIDRWSKQALDHHYESYVGELLRRIPAAERATWTTIVSDSYERATQNFGDDFTEYFKRHYGYDPTPYLLTYNGTVVADAERSNRFLWDLRRMIADRLATDHISALSKRAHKDGLKTWLEGYGHWGFPGEFLQYGGASDEVAGEYWSEGTLGDIENRAASSTAHTYGKPVCWAESFTCGGMEYTRSPRDMKQRGDKFFTEGINGTLLHLVISQLDNGDLPGQNAWFGNEFNRKNTWYCQLDQFTDYLKRCNLMLQQGNYVADIAYYIGEDAPVMTGITEPAPPKGYQYDFINADILRGKATVNSEGRIALPHGTEYRLLVLPPTTAMRPSVIKAVKRLLESGATVLGPRPDHSPSLQDYPNADAEVVSIARELWGDTPERGVRRVGKGLLYTGFEISEIFDTQATMPDFRAVGADSVLYCHLADQGRDIYFVSNQAQKAAEFDARFRVSGRTPELWDATTGSRRPALSYVPAGAATHIPMRLNANESVFVVFEAPDNAQGHTYDTDLNFPVRHTVMKLDGPWKVELTDMFGIKKTLPKAELSDLSKSEDKAVRHFSGTARYTKKFNLKSLPEADKPVILSLGKIGEMARVKLNGQTMGGAWTAPYTVDITPALRKGFNEIEIEVANNWHNRLVGDAARPAGERKTVTVVDTYPAGSPLQPSGLMGPVAIEQ